MCISNQCVLICVSYNSTTENMIISGLNKDRRCMLVQLSVIVIISLLVYVTMETEILAIVPIMVSSIGPPFKAFNNVFILPDTISKQQQIHVHFYNLPKWLKNMMQVFKGCPYNCSMSSGQGHYYDKDVVIFLGPSIRTVGPVPVSKRPGQVWVLYGMEPPPIHCSLNKWKGLFNWTMTYRRDSDFPQWRGIFSNVSYSSARLSHLTPKSTKTYHSDTGTDSDQNINSTAWMVSHCKTQSKREKYVRRLRTTHHVDIYGACGSNKSSCAKGRDRECLKKYKFYLSFENSLCRDYVTEKPFKIYANRYNDVIPITRGADGRLYQIYLPPGSFINTKDYNSTDQLGHFLNYLSKNETLFWQYFEWRRHYKLQPRAFKSAFCDLCKRMHEHDVNTRYRRVYNDIQKWFFGSPDVEICTNPTDILRN
ncbi:alpha-(1,3)-fucosyltransferase C-like [Argopecten irradians]|uniref:alpha-(1,3)-fucosyltransferase C-like n=1 Tax=Argopecten irradians TaxID=31199 RepID=UPI0037168C30